MGHVGVVRALLAAGAAVDAPHAFAGACVRVSACACACVREPVFVCVRAGVCVYARACARARVRACDSTPV